MNAGACESPDFLGRIGVTEAFEAGPKIPFPGAGAKMVDRVPPEPAGRGGRTGWQMAYLPRPSVAGDWRRHIPKRAS